jgi:hypothetical protein
MIERTSNEPSVLRFTAQNEVDASAIDYVDGFNILWRVTERDCRQDPGMRTTKCLVFSCDTAVRRVWNYPADWRSLDPAGLESLSTQR